MRYERLDWDSAFFGFEVGRIRGPFAPAGALADLLDSLREHPGVRLVYAICDSADQSSHREALRCGGFFADPKRTYHLALDQFQPTDWPAQIESADSGACSLRQLRSLAWQSAQYSRFRVDPAMPPGAWRRLYSQWIERSVNRELAAEVLIERIEGRVAGMITLERSENLGSVGLFGVDERFRGRGIGRRLLGASLNRFRVWGCVGVSVVTQGTNEPACRIYQGAGFTLQSANDVFHIWS